MEQATVKVEKLLGLSKNFICLNSKIFVSFNFATGHRYHVIVYSSKYSIKLVL